MNINSILLSFFMPILCLINSQLMAGYGDCTDSLPSASEREVHVMTNAVRMDPQGFRDLYIKGADILKAENYPATTPLWYNNDLSRAARFHSVDMAANCGMTHNSCDGTTFANRVNSFYKGSKSIAENVATGRTTGLLTVIQWLRDDDTQGVPAADKSSDDGHRKNIMNPQYQEVGCGYGYSATRRYNHFWTQDFGGGKVLDYYKIPAGCHFTPNSSTLSYAVNYYDATGAAPETATVIIDGKSYPMELHLGSMSKGTYIYSTTNDGQKHSYYFVFIDGSGSPVRFPQTVNLLTGQQSGCESVNVNKIIRSEAGNIRNNHFTQEFFRYRLDGVKVTGKLQQYYSSGVSVSGKSKRGQKDILLKK